MRLLVVTNMYPSPEHPSDGIFVQRQVAALEALPGVDVRVEYLDTVRDSLKYITGRKQIRLAIEEFAPDVVHIHYGLTQLAVPRLGVPSVVTLHGTDLAVAWQRAVTLHYLQSRDAVVVVSSKMAEAIEHRGSEKHVIPSSVDVVATQRALERLPHRESVVAGRMRVAFGADPSRAVKDYGLYEATCRALETDHGMHVERVVISGLPPSRVPATLRDCDVLVLTSIREGSPTITKEALCCGTRVVSVDVGDVRLQIAGLSGCRVVSTREPQALAKAVLEAGREPGPDPSRSLRVYDAARAADELRSIYVSLMARS